MIKPFGEKSSYNQHQSKWNHQSFLNGGDISQTQSSFSDLKSPSSSNQNNLYNSINKWVQDCSKRSAPNHNIRYQFQIEHCGLEEIRVRDGGEEIWADGIDLDTGQLLEAKFIEHPANSPYVSNSNIPPFIRAKIVGEVENEFRRYGLIINDQNTPFTGLRVIVNRAEALPFFTKLLTRFNISGLVVVKS